MCFEITDIELITVTMETVHNDVILKVLCKAIGIILHSAIINVATVTYMEIKISITVVGSVSVEGPASRSHTCTYIIVYDYSTGQNTIRILYSRE